MLVSHSDRMNKESYRTVTRPAGLRAKCDKVPSNGGLNLKDVKVISNRLPHSITLAIDVMAMGVQITSDPAPDGAGGLGCLDCRTALIPNSKNKKHEN